MQPWQNVKFSISCVRYCWICIQYRNSCLISIFQLLNIIYIFFRVSKRRTLMFKHLIAFCIESSIFWTFEPNLVNRIEYDLSGLFQKVTKQILHNVILKKQNIHNFAIFLFLKKWKKYVKKYELLINFLYLNIGRFAP